MLQTRHVHPEQQEENKADDADSSCLEPGREAVSHCDEKRDRQDRMRVPAEEGRVVVKPDEIRQQQG